MRVELDGEDADAEDREVAPSAGAASELTPLDIDREAAALQATRDAAQATRKGAASVSAQPVPAPAPLEGVLAPPSHLDLLLARGRLRATLTMLGPAFVAAIAYVDPGNFATNIRAARSSATCCCGSCCSRT